MTAKARNIRGGEGAGRRAGQRRPVQQRPVQKNPVQQRRAKATTTTIALLVPAALVLLPTCILLAPAMLPTAVAFYVDRSRDKGLALSVGPLNLCGALFFLTELWRRGHNFQTAFSLLGDPLGWLAAFAGAALGWTIYLAMPLLVARIMAAKQQLRLTQLRASQKALVEEWGEAVAEDSRAAADEAS